MIAPIGLSLGYASAHLDVLGAVWFTRFRADVGKPEVDLCAGALFALRATVC
jgi:hypothetical protein